jgi:hypothetical protein
MFKDIIEIWLHVIDTQNNNDFIEYNEYKEIQKCISFSHGSTEGKYDSSEL